jgi:hypothetical protein
MGDIYAKALLTRIWLGPVEEDELHAINDTLYIMKAICHGLMAVWEENRGDDREAKFDALANRYVHAYCAESGTIPVIQWSRILHVLSFAWFNRVWVNQEFIKSDSMVVHIGDAIVQWEIIFYLAATLSRTRH